MRVSTAAFCTLTALAAGDLTQKAIAAPTPESPNAEDLAVSSDEQSTEVIVTAIAPTESISVEPFSAPKVPEALPDAVASAAEPPLMVEPSFIPVADLVTPNTAPEAIPTESFTPAAPDSTTKHRPILSRMTAEAELPALAPAELIAQAPISPAVEASPAAPDPTDQEVEELQRQLDGVPNLQPEFGDEVGGAPAITISNPSGRGADRFTAFLNTSFQADKRYENGADGTLGVGIGVGDARRAVGLQLSYTLASFGTLDRDFGTGGFNAKLHHQFDNGLSVALGWEGFATIGNVDFKDTIYGSVTQIIRTTPDINRPLSRIALTAGVGNGRFRSEDDITNNVDNFSPFGSAAVRIARPVSVIVEWTGQDLAAGVSITPFRNFPLVITPALRDITGAGDGARFVVGTGVSFQF
jgi:hypothetical protein